MLNIKELVVAAILMVGLVGCNSGTEVATSENPIKNAVNAAISGDKKASLVLNSDNAREMIKVAGFNEYVNGFYNMGELANKKDCEIVTDPKDVKGDIAKATFVCALGEKYKERNSFFLKKINNDWKVLVRE